MSHAELVRLGVSRFRRERASHSPVAFGRTYLPHHFETKPSPMHAEIDGLLKEASIDRGARFAIAAPRGHAKSTLVTLSYVLWSVLYGHDRFVMIVSATKEQASQLLKHVKDEIETNPRLHEDFPEASPHGPAGKPSPWRGGKLQLPSGALLWSVGLGQQIRGIRHQSSRPSLIVVDDLEMPEHVISAEQRHKTAEWFRGSLLKCGDDRTNVVVVGTVLHYDALLSNLLDPNKSPGWVGRRYKALLSEPGDVDRWATWEAIYCGREHWVEGTDRDAARAYFEAHREEMEEGASVLWPEREPLEALMEIRVREGRASFDSEKQNEPLDPEHCLFKLESMSFWDDEHPDATALLGSFPKKPSLYIACDPAVGRNPRKGDYTAILVGARHYKSKQIDVVAADLSRRSPSQTIDRIVEYAVLYNPKAIAVESNGFQELLVKELRTKLRHRGISPSIREVRNTGDKQARIAGLQPRIEQGMIRFSRKHMLLLEQFRQFPLGAHDDGPDALEMLVEISQYIKPQIGWIDLQTGEIGGFN